VTAEQHGCALPMSLFAKLMVSSPDLSANGHVSDYPVYEDLRAYLTLTASMGDFSIHPAKSDLASPNWPSCQGVPI
jgi:hypothetical protein